jgi:hypothetical protein
MPDVADYETQSEWMEACVPARVEEGNEQEQAVAACLSIWRERGKTMDTTAADETLEGSTADTGNALKAISRTEDELRVGNYIVLFNGRDLEGIKPGTTEVEWLNPDGSRGEYFTKSTQLDSPYTAIGRVAMDVEHGLARQKYGKDAPGRDDVIGYVDWSTRKVDDS